jgi:2-keto-4-pentenoate hydratase/2-oxohepta-3-ene-1,7-dioic acid hydratase in catechol pathway
MMTEGAWGLLSSDGATVRHIDSTDMIDLTTRFDVLAPGLLSGVEVLPLAAVNLLAPIPEPRRNIFSVGKNYVKHAAEFSRSGFEDGAMLNQEVDKYPASLPSREVALSAQMRRSRSIRA